jgi:membrane protein
VKLPGWITRTRTAAQARWHALAERYFWIKHVVLAWNRFNDNDGNHYAGALTYFSFLALFPLLLLAASVLGFVLRHNTELQNQLFDKITTGLPGGFGETVKDSVDAAIRARTSVGLVGLAGLLIAGLGWVGNLRAAVNAVWGLEPPRRNFFLAKVADLIVLVGLGVAIFVSIGLTVSGTALTDKILRAMGADRVAGVHTIAQIAGIVLAVVGDVLIFAWVLVRLPRAELPARIVFKGALFAAVGFEILKLIGTYYIARVTHSPAAGVFGSIIGVLVWIDLVSRFLLYSTAWTATAQQPEPPATEAALEQVGPTVEVPPRAVSPLRLAGTLFGAGAAVGGGAVAMLSARRRRARARRLEVGRPGAGRG